MWCPWHLGVLGHETFGLTLSSAYAESRYSFLSSMMLAQTFLPAFLFLVFPVPHTPFLFPSGSILPLLFSNAEVFRHPSMNVTTYTVTASSHQATACLTAQDQCCHLMIRNSILCVVWLAQYMISFSPSCPLLDFALTVGLHLLMCSALHHGVWLLPKLFLFWIWLYGLFLVQMKKLCNPFFSAEFLSEVSPSSPCMSLCPPRLQKTLHLCPSYEIFFPFDQGLRWDILSLWPSFLFPFDQRLVWDISQLPLQDQTSYGFFCRSSRGIS